MTIAAGEICVDVCASANTICGDPTNPLLLTTNSVSHCESVYTSAVDRVTAATALDDRPEVIPKARSGEWRYMRSRDVQMRKEVSNARRDLN